MYTLVIAALISGLLYAGSFPLASLWPLIFVALIPFFYALDHAGSIKRGALLGFLWGAVISLGLGHWLTNTLLYQYNTSVPSTILFLLLCLILPLGLIYSGFAALYLFMKGDGACTFALLVPSLWVFTEYLRELVPFLIPWGFAGYALWPYHAYIQIVDMTGIYGLSFIIVMINALIYLIFFQGGSPANSIRLGSLLFAASLWRRIKQRPLAAGILAAAFIIPPLYGTVQISRYTDSTAREKKDNGVIPVRLVQGNFGNRTRWSDSSFYLRVHTYLGLSSDKKNEAGRAKLVVWPETVLNASGRIDAGLFSLILSHLDEGSDLIVGGLRKDTSGKGVYNTAYLLTSRGGVHYYDKNILLSFAETSPVGGVLGRFYRAPAEFISGGPPSVLDTDFGRAGLSICFESLYPSHMRESAGEGARFFVNISNDAWFGDSAEPVLHLRSTAFRAVENRRFLVRASNSGISAVVSPTGSIGPASRLFERQVINGEIVPLTGRTIYSMAGDWILYAAAGLLLLALVRIIRE